MIALLLLLACTLDESSEEDTGFYTTFTGVTRDTGPWTERSEWSAGNGNWIAISAGLDATCALTEAGEARCKSEGRGTLPIAPDGPFIDIAVAWGTACAIREDTSIECWGCDNPSGELVCEPPEGTGYSRIDAHSYAMCAQQGLHVICWGSEEKPEPDTILTDFDLGRTGFTGLQLNGSILRLGGSPPLPGTFTTIGASAGATCGIDEAGTTHCHTEVPGIPPTGLVQLDGHSEPLCWRSADGTIGCAPDIYTPAVTTGFAEVDAGDQHACGITTNGEAHCAPAGETWTDFPLRP